MTLRALARGSLLITLANLVPRAGAFLLLPIYTRFLTTSDFGIVSLASSTALLLAIAYRLGLDAALLRMHGDAEPAERRSLYATLAAISLATAAIVTIMAVLVIPVILDPDAAESLMPVILLTLAMGAVNTFQYVPSVWFRATDQTGRYLVLALGAFATVVTVTIALVVVVRLGALGSLAGQLAGAFVMAVAAIGIVWGQRPWRVSGDLARRALDFGLPLLPHSLGGWLLNVSDRWLMGLLLGLALTDALAAIGVYSLGYQLGYAVGLAAISFNAAWLPFLYRVGNGRRGPLILRESTTLVVGGFVTLAAALAILAPDLIGLIAPIEWSAAADVTAVVAFASAANAAALMFASGIYLARATRVMPLLTLVAAGLNIACNLILIPRIGIMGPAWATLAAYAALATMIAVAATRRHPVRIDVGRLAMVAAVAVATTFASRVTAIGDVLPAFSWHFVLVVVTVATVMLILRAPLDRLRAAMAPAPSSVDGLG
ncbi:MAG: lipopolysaccharide biosynthesis protein [Candidatus Limnocylindria bacterium]